jgi:hypothetical protein
MLKKKKQLVVMKNKMYLCLSTGRKNDDPSSSAYAPSLFAWTKSPKKARTSHTSTTAGKTSPKKSLAAARLATRKYRPRHKLITVHKSTSKRTITRLKIPAVGFHEYAVRGNSSVVLNDKLKQCEAILPGVASAYMKSAELEQQLQTVRASQFSLDSVKDDNSIFQFWTGMPSYDIFEALLTYLKPRAEGMQYWKGGSKTSHICYTSLFYSKPGRTRKLSIDDEFFLTLVRLRTGLLLVDLAARFNISVASASSIFTTWINLLYVELKELCCLPNIETMLTNKAPAFNEFRDVHMVMDCTELFTEKPSNLKERKHTFSNYKHHQTFKFLVVLSAHAQPCVVYVSRMYGGRASDKLITSQSQDFLDYAKEMGGRIMCDKGFAGTYKMTPMGIDLVMPAFKGSDRLQFTTSEIRKSADISTCRIHVERIMQRIKIYHIFDGELMQTEKYIAEQIFTVCAYLTNFQRPILR